MKASITSLALFLGAILAPFAQASPVSYGFSNGTRSATVDFAASGTDLLVTLTNTSPYDALVPSDILTGVFFDVIGNPALTRISAMVPAGSAVLVGGTGADITPGDRVVGGEWAYAQTGAVPPNNGGISSAGLSIFGASNLFPGPNLEGPASPDGIQYGITAAGDNLLTGNSGISNTGLIKNAVVFRLGNFNSEPDLLIIDAFFQYGTGLDEPGYPADHFIPEPASLVLLAFGCLGMVTYGVRQRRWSARRRIA
jgi:hypothetical protein